MNTHMPFLTRSPSGESVLFFCQAEETETNRSRRWKLHVRCGSDSAFRINTGFDEDKIECSPTAWHDETGWHVSFVAGGGRHDPVSRIYRMDGPSLLSLSPPMAVRSARTGFIFHEMLVVGGKSGRVFIYGRGDDFALELPGMDLLRLSYQADQPEVLLITCCWPNENEEICSLSYHLETREQYLLESGKFPLYKPTIFGQEIYHAARISKGFESREIQKISYVVRTPCKLVSVVPLPSAPLIMPEIETINLSRSSNLSGTEKHLGSAFALATELQSGHRYRLMFVGHLNEAAEECREYPDLYTRIRAVRKNYQLHGIMPDWESLASLLYSYLKQPTS